MNLLDSTTLMFYPFVAEQLGPGLQSRQPGRERRTESGTTLLLHCPSNRALLALRTRFSRSSGVPGIRSDMQTLGGSARRSASLAPLHERLAHSESRPHVCRPALECSSLTTHARLRVVVRMIVREPERLIELVVNRVGISVGLTLARTSPRSLADACGPLAGRRTLHHCDARICTATKADTPSRAVLRPDAAVSATILMSHLWTTALAPDGCLAAWRLARCARVDLLTGPVAAGLD